MKILLAITGSISAYKAHDIARGLVNEGHVVRVVLTSGALQFVKAETFYYLGVEKTYLPTDDFNIEQKTSNVLHMELVDWLDLLIVAPLSANSLAKFAHGEAPDLLSSIFLALGQKPCVLFPAMNTRMLNAPATQKNLHFIQEYPNVWVHPSAKGELACGDIGEGKLPEVKQIVEVAPLWQPNRKNKKVLITTGATISRLDPVRYLTNPSSGLTGYLLAKEYLKSGYDVHLLYGLASMSEITFLEFHPHCKLTAIESTSDMQNNVQMLFADCDIYISAAAINDIEFDTSATKLKKSELTDSIAIKKAPDVLTGVLEQKRPDQVVIGFAAEAGEDTKFFIDKWNRKKVDLLIGNFVDGKNNTGFKGNSNQYYFIKGGQIAEQLFLTKKELASKLVEYKL